ncbi:hypothetical protein ASPVEDRAFT_237763 [Aspergillus versicolor CBS 583.65]|uniref:Uncharacterized protein n=1 Tax=Aspergillus versicolor CBS 583.65 TaxID=1036611 RepID=A0A1L9P4K0_ASPVE|nr:uncharacterized protein ASPVEDRAFT_237763 [Aspergillus versicolor CBS 583.65]OJI96428.1 hypothetical protein ASPVEDRAFT_237763 [Aspergillus versicolor CBS 583.65]
MLVDFIFISWLSVFFTIPMASILSKWIDLTWFLAWLLVECVCPLPCNFNTLTRSIPIGITLATL